MPEEFPESSSEYTEYLRLSDYDSKLAGKMNYYVLGFLAGVGRKKRAAQTDTWRDMRSLAYFGLCDSERKQGHFELGVAYCQKSLAYDANDAYTHYALALCYAREAAGDAAAVDAANNAKLVAALQGVPFEARRARYRCALVYLDGPGDPAPLHTQGVWEGYILEAPRGSGGFGYDAYFWLPELGLTAAELEPERKNRLSHRGTALQALRSALIGRLS